MYHKMYHDGRADYWMVHKCQKPQPPLTKTQIASAKPKAKPYELSDGGGLAVVIVPTGSKIWRMKYPRPFTKKRTTITYGHYPAVSLPEARRERDADRVRLAQNVDPGEYRKKQLDQKTAAHSATLELIASRWLKVKQSTVSANFGADIWRSLELHVFPELGTKPIEELTAPMVITALRPLEAKGSLETVKRVCQRINEVMVWSVNTGLLKSNSLAGIRAAFERPTKTPLPAIPPSELPALLRDIARVNIKTVTRRLIYWQLHTMVRPDEAAKTQWAEIDFDKCNWIIPAERMKMNRPHTVPLSGQAIGILKSMTAISGNKKFVFPSDIHPSKSINEQTANMALKRAGYDGRLVAHGLRSIASTRLNEEDFNADIIEAALAHIDSNDVRAAYNRSDYLEKRREMMSWWSTFIDQAMAAKPEVSPYA